MRQAEAEGKSLEEAIAKALKELGLNREQVKVEVLSEKRGLFSLFGPKVIRVRVIPLAEEQVLERAKVVLSAIFDRMEIRGSIAACWKDQRVFLDVQSPEGGLLIGHGGRTLEALQYLVNKILNSKPGRGEKVVLDVEGYRRRREEKLRALASRLAAKVKATGEPVTLAPLSPHDRRIIHLTLQEDRGVKTASEGAGFYRRVIITPSSPS